VLFFFAGFCFFPNEPRADEALPSSSSSSLKDLEGLMFFKTKSLISSPDKVS
jgi:hypothetical protein